MSTQLPVRTIGITFPLLNMTLDGTERFARLIPEDKLDWRLPDPTGRWHFSLAEIAMHCADARILFARQLSGSDRRDGYWSAGPTGEDGVWEFEPYGTKQAILDSLRSSRAELQPFLDLPAEASADVVDGVRRSFEKQVAGLREKGMEKEAAAAELRGPASVIRVLLALAVHENGHKGSLGTLLRTHGVEIQEKN
jgi:hypothetical protein